MIRCFYHSADLDGYCSGAIVKYRFPEAVMYPINYGDPFPWDEIQSSDEVYMVDFCLQPSEDMSKLFSELSERLTWIDHHSSALLTHGEEAGEGGYCIPGIRDVRKAACELTWEYLFPDRPVPLAVKLLSLYDSWTYRGHELEDMVLPFQMRLRMEELDPKDWGHCAALWKELFTHTPLEDLIDEGRLLLRFDQSQKDKYAQIYSFETDIPSWHDDELGNRLTTVHKAIAINLGHTNSKVFDSVWDEGKYDLMIAFVRRSDKQWNVSLYSTKDDIDCGAIAKSFGGGGHKGAAGFQCKELPFEI